MPNTKILSCRLLTAIWLSVLCPSSSWGIDTIVETDPTEVKTPVEGIPYFLPKPAYVVTTSPKLEKDEVVAIEITVDQQLVPDRGIRFLLIPDKGPFTKANTSVSVNQGLLSNVSATEDVAIDKVFGSLANVAFGLKTISALETRLEAISIETEKEEPENDTSGGSDTPRRLPIGVSCDTFKAWASAEYGESISGKLPDCLALKPKMEAIFGQLDGKPLSIPVDSLFEGTNPEQLKTRRVLEGPDSFLLPGGIEICLQLEATHGNDGETDSCFAGYDGEPATKSARGNARLGPKLGYAEDPAIERGAIFAKSEKAMAMSVSITPTVEKVQATLSEMQKKQADALAPHVREMDEPARKDKWDAYVKEKVDAANGKLEEVTDRQKQLREDLRRWLTDSRDYSEGSASLRTEILNHYLKREESDLTIELDKAKKATDALKPLKGKSYDDFVDDLVKHYYFSEGVITPTKASPLFIHQQLAFVPSDETYVIPAKKVAIGATENNTTLSRGVIREFKSSRPAVALELVNIPANMVSGYVDLLKDLISIKVETRAQESANLQAQLTDLENLGKIDDLIHPEATDPALAKIEELKRMKELLQLEIDLAQLKTSPAPPDEQTLEHLEDVLILQRQKEILQLQSDIQELLSPSEN